MKATACSSCLSHSGLPSQGSATGPHSLRVKAATTHSGTGMSTGSLICPAAVAACVLIHVQHSWSVRSRLDRPSTRQQQCLLLDAAVRMRLCHDHNKVTIETQKKWAEQQPAPACFRCHTTPHVQWVMAGWSPHHTTTAVTKTTCNTQWTTCNTRATSDDLECTEPTTQLPRTAAAQGHGVRATPTHRAAGRTAGLYSRCSTHTPAQEPQQHPTSEAPVLCRPAQVTANHAAKSQTNTRSAIAPHKICAALPPIKSLSPPAASVPWQGPAVFGQLSGLPHEFTTHPKAPSNAADSGHALYSQAAECVC